MAFSASGRARRVLTPTGALEALITGALVGEATPVALGEQPVLLAFETKLPPFARGELEGGVVLRPHRVAVGLDPLGRDRLGNGKDRR